MLFNDEAHGKAVFVSGSPLLVHRTSGAGQPPNRARTLCGKRLLLFKLQHVDDFYGVETTADINCIACIAAECA